MSSEQSKGREPHVAYNPNSTVYGVGDTEDEAVEDLKRAEAFVRRSEAVGRLRDVVMSAKKRSADQREPVSGEWPGTWVSIPTEDAEAILDLLATLSQPSGDSGAEE